jgi:hypothetical protein
VNRILFTILFCSAVSFAQAQSTHDIMFGGGFDFLKTDIHSLLSKAQVGFEGHYFVERHFAVGIGTELWANNQKNSFMMGARWYADDHFFLRFRGLIGVNDASFGLGYAKPLDKHFRLEGIGDYYFGGAAFAFRFGISYVLK